MAADHAQIKKHVIYVEPKDISSHPLEIYVSNVFRAVIDALAMNSEIALNVIQDTS